MNQREVGNEDNLGTQQNKEQIRAEVEKEIEQQYHQYYLRKIEEMQENVKEIEEQNLAKVICQKGFIQF